jgi:hypothetical protein
VATAGLEPAVDAASAAGVFATGIVLLFEAPTRRGGRWIAVVVTLVGGFVPACPRVVIPVRGVDGSRSPVYGGR